MNKRFLAILNGSKKQTLGGKIRSHLLLSSVIAILAICILAVGVYAATGNFFTKVLSGTYTVNSDPDPNPVTLDYLEIVPADPGTIPVGGTANLEVIGHMTDSSTINKTTIATWSSGMESVATVTLVGNYAVLTGVSPGSATITATFGTKTDTCTVIVMGVVPEQMVITAGNLNYDGDGGHGIGLKNNSQYDLTYIDFSTTLDPTVGVMTVTGITAGDIITAGAEFPITVSIENTGGVEDQSYPFDLFLNFSY